MPGPGPRILPRESLIRANGQRRFCESPLDMHRQFHERGNSGAFLAGKRYFLHIMVLEREPNNSEIAFLIMLRTHPLLGSGALQNDDSDKLKEVQRLCLR